MNFSIEHLFSESNLQWIEVSKLQAGKKWQMRVDYQSQDQLTESIKEHGVLEPLLVQYKDTGEFIIIAGERRFRSAKILKLHAVPCRILRVTDSEASIISIVENIQRKNFSPLEEAQGYKSLSDQGFTQERIAQSVGKSRTYIANTIRLLQLPQKIQNMLANNEITLSHARSLINCPDNLKKANQIVSQKQTVQDAFKQERDDMLYIEEQLSSALNVNVSISCNRKNKGKITIIFKDLKELDILVERIIDI